MTTGLKNIKYGYFKTSFCNRYKSSHKIMNSIKIDCYAANIGIRALIKIVRSFFVHTCYLTILKVGLYRWSIPYTWWRIKLARKCFSAHRISYKLCNKTGGIFQISKILWTTFNCVDLNTKLRCLVKYPNDEFSYFGLITLWRKNNVWCKLIAKSVHLNLWTNNTICEYVHW